jgi:hypothetical protein
MTTLNEVMEKVRILTEEAESQPEAQVSIDVLKASIAGLDGLIGALRKTKKKTPAKARVEGRIGALRRIQEETLSKKDMNAALAHSISAEICSCVSLDKERKAFFTTDYFKRKFEALPKDRERVAAFIKGTKPSAYLNPLLLYHYLSGPEQSGMALKSFLDEIRSEYKNSPAVMRREAARSLFRKLLAVKDVKAVTAELETSLPAEDQLKGFVKMIGMKIPAQARGKGAPRKTAYERLAEAIHREGAVVRMDLREA